MGLVDIAIPLVYFFALAGSLAAAIAVHRSAKWESESAAMVVGVVSLVVGPWIGAVAVPSWDFLLMFGAGVPFIVIGLWMIAVARRRRACLTKASS